MAKCPDSILRLVERFNQHADTIRAPGYNETQIRIDFINPMFAALGWDMDNTQSFAEQYREVVHEDKVKVAGQTKAPDYSFRVGGQRKFFLEAKKPAVDIKNNWEPAYQLRRYAWSARLPCSLLTDFEELAIYDTRIPPRHLEKASIARREFIRYTEYESRWDFIDGTFSKAAVLRGDFDKYCESKKGRGVELFDDAFLAEIEEWRKSLASNLALRNESLEDSGLNFAVQRIIDRILFLRIAEDRGTETIGQLQSLLNGDHVYDRLKKLFRDADARYNSGIFHFQKEKDRDEAPDTLTPELEIDDKTLKQIITALYYPKSPYEFTMVSADILGSVYERFLGKVITLTPGHRAKIEEKPEVRKAGGVYYTPTYIVDYIVKNTVGKLLEGKSPDQARTIKVLDPACGSGSFLIGAYQFLLDWYLTQYLATNPAQLATGKSAVLRPTQTGGYALTIAQRKRILLDHIHGVDLDSQAVEVTKLNLLLKCLEGETSQTLGFEAKLFKERALPDLGNNILCGNSLIGTDIVGTDAWKKMTEEERARVNPFDGERAFPKVFKGKGGGFDAVIGNPPYGAFATEKETMWLRGTYATVANSLDTFIMFVEKSASQLRVGGFVGMIIPSGWVSTPSSKSLRHFFMRNFVPTAFVSLPFDVFADAYVDCVVFAATRKPFGEPTPGEVELVVFPHRYKIRDQEDFSTFSVKGNTRSWLGQEQEFLVTLSQAAESALGKVRAQPHTFSDFIDLKRGIETYKLSGSKANLSSPRLAFDGVLQRYLLEPEAPKYLEYTNEIELSKPWAYFSQPRLLLRQVLSRKLRLQATFTDEAFLTNQSIQSALSNGKADLRWLLALLNSRLLSWFFVTSNAAARRDDFPKIVIKQTRELPMPSPTKSGGELVALVDTMLSLHKRLPAEKLPQRREQLQREIDATDRQIDALVYQLYGLTEAEIKIVEDATA
jgi:type I restriction-modification system DNA methylase subunit